MATKVPVIDVTLSYPGDPKVGCKSGDLLMGFTHQGLLSELFNFLDDPQSSPSIEEVRKQSGRWIRHEDNPIYPWDVSKDFATYVFQRAGTLEQLADGSDLITVPIGGNKIHSTRSHATSPYHLRVGFSGEADEWMFVALQDPWPDHRGGCQPLQWIFGVKSTGSDADKYPYRLVDLPEGFRIGDHGQIYFEHKGKNLWMDTRHPLWPEILVKRNLVTAVCCLEYLLQPDDGNPLTAVIQTSQPTRAHGINIKRELEEVLKLLKERNG